MLQIIVAVMGMLSAVQDPAPASPRKQDEAPSRPPAPTPVPHDPSQPGEREPEIRVSLKDGVHFKSADGNFDIILGGYTGIHWRTVAHRPQDGARTSPDAWYIRQARPELSGFIYRDFDFRIQLDFPTGPASINGVTQDVYVGWRRFPEFSLRVGQIKEPFGQEQTTPDRFLDFNERSQADRFTPSRDIGALAFGTLGGGVLTYEVGFFNGQGRTAETNKGKEEAARVRVQPFAGSDDDFLFKHLRLGVAGTTAMVQNSSMAAFTSNSAYLNINYLTAAGAAALDGRRVRWGGEATWNYGPFGLRAEAWRRVDTVDAPGGGKRRLRMDAWNVHATWLLTGEQKPLENRVAPLQPFDPGTGAWGAVELAFRADRLRLDDDLFDLGFATATGNANAVSAYSFGLNWFLTRNIRISPNVYWEVFDDPILFSTGRADRHFFGAILRFQLEF